jgi:hypothetical protein
MMLFVMKRWELLDKIQRFFFFLFWIFLQEFILNKKFDTNLLLIKSDHVECSYINRSLHEY